MSVSLRFCAFIVAAGEGSRFGGRKQFALLGAKPLLAWSLELFDGLDGTDSIIVAAPADQVAEVKGLASLCRVPVRVVAGGGTRGESVLNCICVVEEPHPDYVLVHDAARPLADRALVGRVIQRLGSYDGVVPGVAVSDTIKSVRGGRVEETLDRERLRAVQTPQGFRFTALRAAHELATEKKVMATDDAALLEAAGYSVGVVEGDPANIKITLPDDLEVARVIAERRAKGDKGK